MSHDNSLVGRALATMAEGNNVFDSQVTRAQEAVAAVQRALDALPALQAALGEAATTLGAVGTNLPQTDVIHYQGAIAAAQQSSRKLTTEAADLQASLPPVVAPLQTTIPQIMTVLGDVQRQFGAGVRTGDDALGRIQNS